MVFSIIDLAKLILYSGDVQGMIQTKSPNPQPTTYIHNPHTQSARTQTHNTLISTDTINAFICRDIGCGTTSRHNREPLYKRVYLLDCKLKQKNDLTRRTHHSAAQDYNRQIDSTSIDDKDRLHLFALKNRSSPPPPEFWKPSFPREKENSKMADIDPNNLTFFAAACCCFSALYTDFPAMIGCSSKKECLCIGMFDAIYPGLSLVIFF